MEAPDKIYVQLPSRSWIGKSWDETPNSNCNATNVEYIRKDVVDDMLKTAEDHAYFAGSEAMREKAINSVWHSTDETPKEGSAIVSVTDTKEFLQDDNFSLENYVPNWNGFIDEEKVTRWAYKSDLLSKDK